VSSFILSPILSPRRPCSTLPCRRVLNTCHFQPSRIRHVCSACRVQHCWMVSTSLSSTSSLNNLQHSIASRSCVESQIQHLHCTWSSIDYTTGRQNYVFPLIHNIDLFGRKKISKLYYFLLFFLAYGEWPNMASKYISYRNVVKKTWGKKWLILGQAVLAHSQY